MTAAHAASSISTLVRDIHRVYTMIGRQPTVVRIWTPPYFASNLFEDVRHDCARISGLLSRHTF